MEMETDKEQTLSFGRYLQTARKEKGVSLEALHEETCISPLRLKAIETEDHEQLPAEVFVKGFIRSYAKAVNADGDKAVELYEQSLDRRYTPVRVDTTVHLKKPALWPKVTAAAAILILIIGLSAWGINKFLSPSPGPPEQEVASAPVVEPPGQKEEARPPAPAPAPGAAAVSEAEGVSETKPDESAPAPEEAPAAAEETGEAAETPASEAPAQTPEPAQAEAAQPPAAGETGAVAQPMNLRIEAKELTWLKVITDEDPPREYSLKPGDVKVLKAESSFNLLVGNAGGIVLTLDGKELASLGKSGQVVNVELP